MHIDPPACNALTLTTAQPQAATNESQTATDCCGRQLYENEELDQELTWSSNWDPLTYERVISRSLSIVAMNQSSAPAGW